MLIDTTYFTFGLRHIQNSGVKDRMPSPDAIAVDGAISAYILHYQHRFLASVLTAEYADAVDCYLKAKEKDTQHDTEKVIEQLREPFANYVFYKILRDANTQATITGVVLLKCANEYVSPARRQAGAWNEMVDMLEDYRLWAKAEGFGSWLGNDKNLLTKINTLNL